MNKKDYKLAYDYIYHLINLDDESMKWPLTIDSMNIFKELVDEKLAKPTEEEITKEWEEKGWKITISNREIEIENNKSLSTIYIDKKDKMFWSTHYLPVDLIQLLTKTFKMLGYE